jgi:hypothetical protein
MPAPWLLKRFVGVVRISAHGQGARVRWTDSVLMLMEFM